ncbi:MAG: hypothetical protein HYW47_07850 [Deltaproteobacteria bacterium]|nr:hypothetical protein [Deltaproteobacteria bacterium]
MAQKQTRVEFLNTVRGFTQARIIHVATKYDLFDTIPEGGLNSKELSKLLDFKPGPSETLCNALVSLGLLKKHKTFFSLTSFSKEYLVSTSKNYLGFLIKHLSDMMEGYIHLDETLKTGKPLKTLTSITKNKDYAKDFTLTMHTISSYLSPQFSKLLDLSTSQNLIDIGGGPGTYSIQLCKDNPKLHATILDLPSVLSVTKKIIRQYQLTDRIQCLPLDYSKDPIPHDYDVALLSNIIHIEGPEANNNLIQKVYNALSHRGMIIIQDYVLNDDLTEPLDGALFAISMLLYTDKGRCYSFKEIQNWLHSAGFKKITEIKPRAPRRASLIYAHKF